MGNKAKKEHILWLLHSVQTNVFTPENNHRALEVTGLTRPVQLEKLSPRATAPSIEFSTMQSSFPLPLPTPVQQAASIMAIVSNLDAARSRTTPAVEGPQVHTPTQAHHPSPSPMQGTLNVSPSLMKINPTLFTPSKQA